MPKSPCAYAFQVDEDDPEGRQLGVTLYLHATALLRQERELTMLTDLYSTACDLRCEVSPLSTISFLETMSRRQTIREILEIGVSADSILSLSADCGQVFISREEGTTVLRTAITVRALYLDEGGVPLSVERTVDGSCRLELPEHCAVRGEAVCPEEVQGSLSPRGIEVRFPVEFQVEAAQETEQRVKDATDGLAESYGFVSEGAEQAAASTEQVVEKTEEQIQAETDLAKEVYTAQKEIAQAHKEAADEITQAYDSAKETAENAFSVNPFDAWSQDTESGIAKMQDALESQIEGMATYESNLRNVSEHVGKEITPEFLHYLESLGTEGAQVMQELSDAFDDHDTEKIEKLMQAYVDAMNQQDAISRALAADAVAFQLGLGEFSSTAEEWQGLDSAVAYVQQVGGEVTEATLTAFQEAEKTARECGVKIPDGLTEGIEEGSEDPEAAIIDATQKLNAAIKGRADGLLKAAREAGIPIPNEIAKGIEEGGDSAVTAYQSLIDLIASSNTEQAASASKETGNEIGGGVTEGIEEETGAAADAAQSLTESAKDAAVSAATGFNV